MDHENRHLQGWGFEQWLGAAVVIAIAAGIALTIWPGWTAMARWF